MNTPVKYTRVWDGKILTATVISMNDKKVVYYISNPKNIIMEYTKLFLSVFTIS